MREAPETRLKRLRLRSMRRGIKEMDLILTVFAHSALDRLPEGEVTLYDDLLSENDHDILGWVIGQIPTPDRYVGLIARVRLAAADLPAG